MQVKELIERLSALDPEAVIHVQDPFSDDPDDYLLDDEAPIYVHANWVVLQLGDRTSGDIDA